MSKITDARPAFFMVEDAVFEYGLTPFEGWVYMAILKHADRQTGVAFPGIGKLAAMCNMSKSQVIRCIEVLEAKKMLDVQRDEKPAQGEKRQRKPNLYTVKSLTGNAPQTLGVVSTSDYPSSYQTLGVVSTSDNNQSHITRVIEPEVVAAPPQQNSEVGGVYRAYEDMAGTIPPSMRRIIDEAIDEYSAAWLIDAFQIAVENNKRNWRYAEAILKRWKAQGKDDGRTKQPAPSAPIEVANPDDVFPDRPSIYGFYFQPKSQDLAS